MSNQADKNFTLPPGQQAIRDRCFHPSGMFVEFPSQDVESSIPERFEKFARRYPERLAVKTGNCSLTYDELNRAANRIARSILEQPGTSDEPVALLFEHGVFIIPAILGILKAGRIYVPLDPALPPARTAYMLQDSQAKLLLTNTKHLSQARRLAQNRQHILNCGNIDASVAAENLDRPIASQTPALILYTSGSTGRPKGVLHNHRNILAEARNYTNDVRICPEDRLSLCQSCSFANSIRNIYGALLNGAALFPYDLASDGIPPLAEWMHSHRITIFHTLATIIRRLLETIAADASFPALRILRFGGEPTSGDDVKYFQHRFAPNCVLMNVIGLTEAFTIRRYFVTQDSPDGDSKIPLGYGVPGKEIVLLDHARRAIGADQIGEIAVRSKHLALGYWRSPDLTQAAFIPGPDGGEERLYLTGDLGMMRADGCLIHMGRKDFQVKIRGNRVEVTEIEKALLALDSIRAAVVHAQADEAGEQRLVAYVEPAEGKAPTISELRRALAPSLPDYMIPSAFVFLDRIPVVPNGRVDRSALPAPTQARPALDVPYVEPRTSIELELANIWAAVLHVEKVGVDDKFLDLGGHSLLAAQIVSRVLDRFRIEVSLSSLFESPTVAKMALIITMHGGHKAKQPDLVRMSAAEKEPFDEELNRFLAEETPRQGAGDIEPTIPRRANRGPAPLSFAQQRLWFLNQLAPDSPVFNESKAFRLSGCLDVKALQKALDRIVARHEVLRTTFSCAEETPVQVIAESRSLDLPVIDLSARLLPVQEEVIRGLLVEAIRRPFNLSCDLMLRALLLRLGAEEHVLLLVTHHIASDRWSTAILWRELSALYGAFTGRNPSPLAELPIQYADFSVWQRQWFQGEVLQAQLSYWKKQLENIPNLQLPTYRPRPSVQIFRGARQSLKLPEGLARIVKTLSHEQGVTLFMTLLAAFQTLLHRYTGQDYIAVGSPIANRNRVETEELIGFFVNTLVLCTDFSGDPSFRELLGRVREVCLGAYARRDLPFEKLVEELNPERNLSHSPLFQVGFGLDIGAKSAAHLSALSANPIDVDNGATKRDLTLTIRETLEGFIASFEYDKDLFDAATINRMLGHFNKLLESICANPEERISGLPLLTEAERRQLLVDYNQTKTDFPETGCLHRLFEAQAERTPDAIAVIFEDQQLTYRELNRRSNQLAHYLQKLGVGPDALVGIYMERSLEMVVALLGVLKAGGAYVPLDPGHPKQRLAFILEDTAAAVLLTRDRLIEDRGSRIANRDTLLSILDPRIKVVCLNTDWQVIAKQAVANAESAVTNENLAYVIYTSGSTGSPKGVLIEHRQILNYVQGIQEAYGLTPGASYAMVQPLSVDSSQTVIFPPLISGGVLHVISEDRAMDAQALSTYFSRFPPDLLKIAPSHLAALWQAAPHSEELLPRRWLIIGGEAVRPEWVAQLRATARCAIYNHYGPTEATVGMLTYPITKEQSPASFLTVPIGRPLPNTEAYVLDRHLQPVPAGIAGELYIGGSCLARGYLNQTELTAEKFIAYSFDAEPSRRLYKTGDRVRYRPDGNIEFLGRTDHQVKIRGFRVEPGEIEAVLGSHPAIRMTVVVVREVAVEDQHWTDRPNAKTPTGLSRSIEYPRFQDKQLVAYFVVQEGQEVTAGELRRFLKLRLPDYIMPARFVCLSALPLTPHGKVDLGGLPEPDRAFADSPDFVGPRNPVEEMIAAIWSEVMGASPIGVHDNFFELGGHSLKATQVVSRLRKAFQSEIPLRHLFEFPTIAELAAVIDSKTIEGLNSGTLNRVLSEIEAMPEEVAQKLLTGETGRS